MCPRSQASGLMIGFSTAVRRSSSRWATSLNVRSRTSPITACTSDATEMTIHWSSYGPVKTRFVLRPLKFGPRASLCAAKNTRKPLLALIQMRRPNQRSERLPAAISRKIAPPAKAAVTSRFSLRSESRVPRLA